MVALKQKEAAIPGRSRFRKQERRGGIETGDQGEDPNAAGRKQERRGGIETLNIVLNLLSQVGEAGTPWWH